MTQDDTSQVPCSSDHNFRTDLGKHDFKTIQPIRVAFLTGSRSEWGYIRPILRRIEDDPAMDYSIIATNMHLTETFGSSVSQIEQDGFRVDARIHMAYDGFTGLTMTKSLATLLSELPSVLERITPDLLLLAGDRGEQFMGAIAAVHMGIPVAHVQCGELSGNVDGIIRHAITKLAHLHFAANKEFADRVSNLGEQDFRIHVTGAPLVDELVEGCYEHPEKLIDRFHLDSDRPVILAIQHPVTDEEDDAGEQVEQTIAALAEVDAQTLFISPNSDAGSHAIRRRLDQLGNSDFRLVCNLPRVQYLGFLNMAAVIVGNSSSGILEAPTFGTPCVNIGTRQQGRLQAEHVINADYTKESILNGVREALSPEFVEVAVRVTNPYGQGGSSQRILDILKSTPLDDRLLAKRLSF